MTSRTYKLGKHPATHDDRDLRLSTYLQPGGLPARPTTFGLEKAIPTHNWGILGNDKYGDCVWAGAAHETMLWTASHGQPAKFDDNTVLAAYAQCTGFDPDDPSSDQGTDMRKAAGFRRTHGIKDTAGTVHKVGAYVALQPGNWEHLLDAVYLFGAVGIGVEWPSTGFDQFDDGDYLDYIPGARIEGGHYLPIVARRGVSRVVTWGVNVGMTRDFYETYCDEAYAYLSPDLLNNGQSPAGFNLQQLQVDLRAVAGS